MNRRRLLQIGASTVALMPAAASVRAQGEAKKAVDRWHGLKVGVASYTMRQFPLEVAIKAIQRVGLHYVSIKDVHLPFKSSADERKAVAQRFSDAGITPLSCGNVGMKNDEAGIRSAFEYARDIGLPTIVCAPPPEALPILDKMVKEFDIRIAIHNHGPEDKEFPSPYDVWKAVVPFDKRVGLCIDVGHSARAGAEPAEAILKCRERLYDIHLKDINNTTPKGSPVECGRGVLDLKGICRNLLRIGYQHHVGFEYEKDGGDPLPGLAESVGYVHGILATLS
jgi:sugar phosphate isomerase/epimerase